MTLVFGAIPPLAVVFAFPLLLPSVPAEKVAIDDQCIYADDCHIDEDYTTAKGNKYVEYVNEASMAH